jgi:hypothetical protein
VAVTYAITNSVLRADYQGRKYALNPDLKFIKQAPLTNGDLYRRQMAMLESFLEHGAISPEQYRTSADGLTRKMHLQPKE